MTQASKILAGMMRFQIIRFSRITAPSFRSESDLGFGFSMFPVRTGVQPWRDQILFTYFIIQDFSRISKGITIKNSRFAVQEPSHDQRTEGLRREKLPGFSLSQIRSSLLVAKRMPIARLAMLSHRLCSGISQSR